MSTRRRLLGDISTFQLAAGALAAMTSAWIASTLGVAGTIIGAAVGSLVLTTTSAFYSRTLETGRTLIVQTSDGSSVETHAEPGETQEALAAVEEATGSPVQGAEVIDDDPDADAASRDWRTLPWKRIGVSTVAALVIAFGAMSAYEAVTGNAYGADPDATRISNPFSGGSSSSQQQTPGDDAEGGDQAPADPGAPQEDDADGGDEDVTPTPAAPTPTPTPTTPAPTAPPADQ